jgi:NAD+ kinase
VRIALYGTEVKEEYFSVYNRIFHFLKQNNIELVLSSTVKKDLITMGSSDLSEICSFDKNLNSCPKIDLLLSVGGDGTFLNAVSYSLEKDIPIAGVNCGRLGFLADITAEDIEVALLQFINGDYVLEQRSMLQLIQPSNLFCDFNYAVNELTVHKLDNSSMIKIETFINGEFLANYWADGLIIATPTGSTAYSLSVGGPIVTPDLSGLLITPIASHLLTVRPVIVPDDVEIQLRIEGRGNQFLVSIDHRSFPLDFPTHIKVRKATLTVPIVKLKGHSFYSTMRNKLMWGADKRN